MIQGLRVLAAPMLLAGVALFAGVQPTLLVTGRIAPLDWLVPEGGALISMMILAARGGRRAGLQRTLLYLALATLPPLLLNVLSATRIPWAGILELTAILSVTAAILSRVIGRPRVVVGGAILACLVILGGFQGLALFAGLPSTPAADPRVGVMSALRLFHDQRAGNGPLDVGGRAPVLAAARVQGEPLDVLDTDALKGFDRLLLVQPRLLRPEELVALDAWVRAGGRVVILADPLLHWPDGRPLGDPHRAPLTSLLDPLLTHWGLVLEPADARAPEERRVLAKGALLQLASPSRFTLAPGAPCELEERGLIARCHIGEGSAVLVADADWIDDALWTLDPAHPRDPRRWTSDAVPVLERLIRGEDGPFPPTWPWLISQEALISALRWALSLILLLGVLLARLGPIPISTHDPPMPRRGGKADSGGAFPNSG
ncbi:MAG: hypothetical protein J7494_03500 [Sphingobium sp.]|nr:hypothetical protein [Sphingobium sp.]